MGLPDGCNTRTDEGVARRGLGARRGRVRLDAGCDSAGRRSDPTRDEGALLRLPAARRSDTENPKTYSSLPTRIRGTPTTEVTVKASVTDPESGVIWARLWTVYVISCVLPDGSPGKQFEDDREAILATPTSAEIALSRTEASLSSRALRRAQDSPDPQTGRVSARAADADVSRHSHRERPRGERRRDRPVDADRAGPAWPLVARSGSCRERRSAASSVSPDLSAGVNSVCCRFPCVSTLASLCGVGAGRTAASAYGASRAFGRRECSYPCGWALGVPRSTQRTAAAFALGASASWAEE